MQHSAESVKGRIYGTFFLTGFGTLWLLNGVPNGKLPQTVFGIALAGVAASLLAAGFLILQRARRLPNAPLDQAKRTRMKRVFRTVNLVQWLAIFAAILLLNLLHHAAYIVPAASIIVGLHFYPLARLFRTQSHYITGTLLIGWSIGCMAALPVTTMPAIVCLGNGAILLIASAISLLTAYKASAMPRPPQVIDTQLQPLT